MKNQVSHNISYKEAVRSSTATRHGLDNTPNSFQLRAMELVAQKIFQPVRENFCTPIYISSFFRSPKVNRKAGGAKSSSHTRGEAIDMDADVYEGVSNSEIFSYIKDNLSFDQLIWEFGDDENPNWVHASYVSEEDNRGEILIAYSGKGRTKYKYYEEK
jgi:hypothetical protein